MTIAQDTQAFSAGIPDVPPAEVKLPLVSIVVVNHNYGRFLAAAVESVFAQTYPRVECIVVDDASRDESASVLDALARRHPELTVLRRPTNGGQTQAALDGLAACHGPYVIFVDADDILLPRCAETHMRAHLSLRWHVGFTSGDMLQAVDGEVVVGTGSAFNDYLRRRKPIAPADLRPYHHPFGSTLAAETAVAPELYYVPPRNKRWVWSPTSGTCFRRDALMLFADTPGLADLRTGTDMYFSHAIGGLCGSVLIDTPVFAYRLHGGNLFTHRAQLDGVLAYVPGGAGDSNDKARLLIVDHLVEKMERFTPTQMHKTRWMAMLIRLDVPDGDRQKPRWARRSRAASMLLARFGTLADRLGRPMATALLVFFGVPLRRILGALQR